jgi:hypothetical protein
MSQLRIAVPPTFNDLADSAISANKCFTDDSIGKISDNAKFAMVRTEIIPMGFYKHGDTVGYPTSPVDGYVYSGSDQVIYDFQLYSTRAPNTATGQLALVGVHTAGTGYVVGDILGVTQANAGNGLVQVSSVGGGGAVTGLSLISGGLGYSTASNLATAGGTGTGCTVDVPLISSVFFSGQSTPPILSNDQGGNLFYFIADIPSSRVVSLTTHYLNNNGAEVSSNDGIVKVYAVCQRTGLSLGAIPTFKDAPEGTVMVAQPLREGNQSSPARFGALDISYLAKFATVRTEIIPMGFWSGGQTIPVPASPVDGYQYQRGEVRYKGIIYTTLHPNGFTQGTSTPPTVGSGLTKRLLKGPLYWHKMSVDDTTGITACGVSYYIPNGAETIYDGSAPNNAQDGVLKVYAICQRMSVNAVVLGVNGGIGSLGGIGAGAGAPTNVDGAVPDAPVVGIVYNNATTNSSRYHILIGVDRPATPANWNFITSITVQVSTDPTFVTFPAGQSLNATFGGYGYEPVIPFTTPFETNFPGTYYIRAAVTNSYGISAWANYNSSNGLSTDILDKQTDDTGPCSVFAITLSTKAADSDIIPGNQIQVQFNRPLVNGATYFGYTIIAHDSGTLPTVTKFDTGTHGSIVAGVAILTDLTKSFTPGALVGKYVVAFDSTRSVTPTYDFEGQIIMAKINANTSTAITFDAHSQNLHRTRSNLLYYIVNDGNLFWQIVKFSTPCILDVGITGYQDSRKRTETIPAISGADTYVWVIAYNDFGTGLAQTTFSGHARPLGIFSNELSAAAIAALSGAESFNTDIVFSASDYRTVNWTSGSIKTSAGTTYSISSGSTGPMTATTYIYFDPGTSTTTLQFTTSYSVPVGSGIIVLCFAKNTSDTSQNALCVPTIGVLGINQTVIGPNSIATANIQAAAITTNTLAANSVTSVKISVASLGAIVATIGTIYTSASGGRTQIDSTSGVQCFDAGGILRTQIPTSGAAGNILTTVVQGITNAVTLQSNNGSNAIVVSNSAITISAIAAIAVDQSIDISAGSWDYFLASGRALKTHAGTGVVPIDGSDVEFYVSGTKYGQFTNSSGASASNLWVTHNSSLKNVLTFNDGLGHDVLYV